MNFYLEALQDEHQLLLKALPGYRGAVERVGARIRALLCRGKGPPPLAGRHGLVLVCGPQRGAGA